jgi:hypothetical protein
MSDPKTEPTTQTTVEAGEGRVSESLKQRATNIM